MKRSFREIIELAVVGVFAITAANGLLWVLGHVLRVTGFLGKLVIIATGWLWSHIILYLLVATILIILVYFLIKNILSRRSKTTVESTSSVKTVSSVASSDSEESTSSSKPLQ